MIMAVNMPLPPKKEVSSMLLVEPSASVTCWTGAHTIMNRNMDTKPFATSPFISRFLV